MVTDFLKIGRLLLNPLLRSRVFLSWRGMSGDRSRPSSATRDRGISIRSGTPVDGTWSLACDAQNRNQYDGH